MMLTPWQQQCMKMQRQVTPPNYATFFCLLYKVLYNLCLGFHGFIHQTAWRVDSKRGGGQRVDDRQVGLGPWASEHVMCTLPTELPERPFCCVFNGIFSTLLLKHASPTAEIQSSSLEKKAGVSDQEQQTWRLCGSCDSLNANQSL